MKQFFKFMLASMVGFFLASILTFIFLIFMLSGMLISAAGGGKASPVKEGSVIEMDFDRPVPERTEDNPFEGFSFGEWKVGRTLGLDKIITNIQAAKTDPKIKGILLNLTSVNAGISTIEEIRSALLDFKKGGKFIYAYSENYSQGAYYLSTVADSVFLNPKGSVDFHGLTAELAFFKGTLEKLEIEPEVIRHGKFKSAVEPFLLDRMSPENRQQFKVFLGSIWDHIIQGVSSARGISTGEVQLAADSFVAREAEAAVKARLIDRAVYYDEVLGTLRKKTGKGKDDDMDFISLRQYDRSPHPPAEFSTNKVAVIYAAGDIVSGEGDRDEVGSDKIAAAIRKARKDPDIVAIVLRVNSPGGSALASEVIWREMSLTKGTKPLVVSMGDYAASGGYYISCIADTIVAQPTTITGSIGVFGLLFNAQNMFKNKLGITFDTVKTGHYPEIGSYSRPMSDGEKEIVHQEIEKIYSTFVDHVAKGRGLTNSFVDSIGQGRVWSGTDAVRLGLVDLTGGLNDAVKIAAKMAGTEKYRVVRLPQAREFLEKFLEDFGTETSTYFAKRELGEDYRYYSLIRSFKKNQGIQARLPWAMEIY